MKFDSVLLRLSIATFFGFSTWQVYNLRKLPKWTERQITREAELTRTATTEAVKDNLEPVLKEVKAWRKDTDKQITHLTDLTLGPENSLRTDVMHRIDTLSNTLNTSIADADKQLTQANTTITELKISLKPTLDNVESITKHADEASAILFRRDALPAQILGLTAAAKVTLGETAQTMRQVRIATPMFVEQGKNITDNFNGLTSNLNRLTKPHWYDRALGYGLNGMILYRQLHPAGIVVSTAVEALSSRK